MKSALTFFFILNCFILFSQEQTHGELKSEKLYKIEQWEKQLEAAKERGDVYTQMIILKDLVYFKVNDFGDNTSTYEDLRLLEKLLQENPNSRARVHIEAPLNMFLGCILRDQNNLNEALIYMTKAVEVAKQNNEVEFYKDASCHRAEILGRLGQKEEALNDFRRLEKEAIESNDSILKNRVYEVMSSFYMNEEKIDSTLYYAKKSIDEFSPDNQRSFRLNRVAECYLILDREIDSVIYYAERALDLATISSLEKEQRIAHWSLSQAYHVLDSIPKAYYHFKKFYDLQQQQRSFENALQIGTINIEREKEAAKLQQVVSEERLSNQRMIIWIVSSGLLILTIGVFYIFNRLKFIKKQNKIIAQEKERAERSEKYKEQFLANMSHEIRTPMHAISGITNTLLRKKYSKDQNPYLEALKTSSDNLLMLLDDVLDLSKIESGELEIEKVAYNPVNVIENVVKVLKFRAADKGLNLKYNIEKNTPKNVMGDPNRLYQILTNLVGNSIKFTDKGRIEIKLSVKEDKDKYLQFCVSDTGIGIPKSKISHIFETFKQGDKSKSQIFKGTGLGLSISKKLVELQEGRIWIESKEGKGSQFYFELPIIESEAEEIGKVVKTESDLIALGEQLKGIKILLAEDDDFNVMVLEDDLNYFIKDYNLTKAKNGREVIAEFKKGTFDLVLMDMHMPVLNGIEATIEIRKIESSNNVTKHIPILAMTANIVKSELDKCIESGMNAVIPKPYKPEQLLVKLSDYYF